MIKSFLILIKFSILLFSSQQIVLVVADDFETSKAQLEFYEDGQKIFFTNVSVGKKGLAWGLGDVKLHQNEGEPIKVEGDKKAPAGVFKLTHTFAYDHTPPSNLPHLFAPKELICVDDSDSGFYNQIIMKQGGEKSFEWMRRDDHQYSLGVVIAQNEKAKENHGSCVFIHIEEDVGIATSGCTALTSQNMQKFVSLLDKDKNPIIIQIPKSSSQEILNLYPQLKSSSLLHPRHP